MSAVISVIDGYASSSFYNSKKSTEPYNPLHQKDQLVTIGYPNTFVRQTTIPVGNATLAGGTLEYEISDLPENLGEMFIQVKLSDISAETGATYCDYPGLAIGKAMEFYTDQNHKVRTTKDFIQDVMANFYKLPEHTKVSLLASSGGIGFTGGNIIIPLGFMIPWSILCQGGNTEVDTFPNRKLKSKLRFVINLRAASAIVSAGVTSTPTFASTPTLYYYNYITDEATRKNIISKPYMKKILIPKLAEPIVTVATATDTTIDLKDIKNEVAEFIVYLKDVTVYDTNHKYFDTVNIDKKIELMLESESLYKLENNNSVDNMNLLRRFEQMIFSKKDVEYNNLHTIKFSAVTEPNIEYDNALGSLNCKNNKYTSKSIVVRQDSGSSCYGYVIAMEHAWLYIDGNGQLKVEY